MQTITQRVIYSLWRDFPLSRAAGLAPQSHHFQGDSWVLVLETSLYMSLEHGLSGWSEVRKASR